MGMNAVQIAFAALGATFTDTVGRRPMLLVVNIVCAFCWIGVTVPASIANITDLDNQAQIDAVTPPVSKAILAWVYLFQIFYSVGWTPLQALYPVEVLSYEMRAKGMAFSSLFTNAAMLVMQFGIPVALKNIAWKTYIVFCIWCVIQSIILYFLVPETKNRTVSYYKYPPTTNLANRYFYSSRSLTLSSLLPALSRLPSRRRFLRPMPTPTLSTSSLRLLLPLLLKLFMS
jgi:hypothetical protein